VKQLGKFSPPKLSTTTRDGIGTWTSGNVIYNTTEDKLQFYDGVEWKDFYASGQPVDPGDIGGGAASMVMSFASGSTKHVETTSSTYANLAHFIYGGSDAIGAITKINVNAWVIGNSTADIRLVIKDNGLVIAEYIGINSNNEANDFDIGTLSNIPTGREVIEIQARKVTGGGGAKLRIGSLELEY
jgi:hypothetical protein